MSLFAEFFDYLRSRKKLWLTPLIVLFLLFGALFILVQSSPVLAPFIYTLF